MKRFVALLLPIALMGNGGFCVSTRYAPTHCLTAEQLQQLKEAEPERVNGKLTGNAAEDVKTIAGSAVRLRTYAGGLLNVLGGCVG